MKPENEEWVAAGGDGVLDTLRIIAHLFAKYREGGSATFIEQLIESYEQESPTFVTKINSIEMWGGMGSVWDYQKFWAWSPDISEQEARSDDIRLRKAMIALVDY